MTPFYLDSVSEDTIFLTYGAIKETVENVGLNVIKKVSLKREPVWNEVSLNGKVVLEISKHGHSLISAIYSVEPPSTSDTSLAVPIAASHYDFGIKANQGQTSDPCREITWALRLMKPLPLTARCSSGKPRAASFLNVQNSALWTESGASLLLPSPPLQWSSKLRICWQPWPTPGIFKTLGSWSCVWYCSVFFKVLDMEQEACHSHHRRKTWTRESGVLEFRILLCHLYLSMQGCCLILWTWRFPLWNFRRIVPSSWRSCKHYVWQHIKALSTESGHNMHLIKGKSNRHLCSIHQGLGIALSESNLTHPLNPL